MTAPLPADAAPGPEPAGPAESPPARARGVRSTWVALAVVLFLASVGNLRLCDSVVLLHEGRLCFQGQYDQLLASHGSESIEAIYGGYQHASLEGTFVGFDQDRSAELPTPPEPSC